MINQSTSTENTRQKGTQGEDIASDYLVSQGFQIISRNFQSKKGELDCIAKDPKGTLVFIEVKYSKSGRYGNPAFWVTKQKQRTIAFMAKRYLADHNITQAPCRFDVIAITNGKIDHYKNAFFC